MKGLWSGVRKARAMTSRIEGQRTRTVRVRQKYCAMLGQGVRSACWAGIVLKASVFAGFVLGWGLGSGSVLFAQGQIWRSGQFRALQQYSENPAVDLPHGFGFSIVSIPGVNFGHTGFAYRDLIRPQGDSFYLDVENAIQQMRTLNWLYGNVPLSFLVVWRPPSLRNHLFSVEHRLQYWVQIAYSRDMIELLWYGNYRYAGQTKELRFEPRLLFYSDFALGYTYHSERWSVGGRLHIYSGFLTFWTKQLRGSLYTASDLDTIVFRAEGELLAASTIDFWDTSKIKGVLQDPMQAIAYFKNMGLGIDVGFRYRVNDRLEGYAVVRDLGYISWSPPNAYTVRARLSADKTYTGLDIREIIFYDSTLIAQLQGTDTVSFSALEDSLRQVFQIQDEVGVSFKTMLPTYVGVGGRYHLGNGTEVWLSAGGYLGMGLHPVIGAGVHKRVLPWVTAGIHFGYKNRYPFNVGASVLLTPGPLQIALVTDNLPGLFFPKKTRSFHSALHVNLFFARNIKEREVRY